MKREQPIDSATIARHGLTPEEYSRVEAALGRAPNLLELGIFSVMWSEHCSYKSSRKLLRGLPTSGPRVLVGPGENAGVVEIGDGLAVAFKMESHNHPSYIEPTQGAATGVGGILRDVFTMGARPVASLDLLRFGDPSHPKTPFLVEGVVAGIGGYGNAIGVPTVGGEVAFDHAFDGNCLVNAFTVGVLRKDKIFLGRAAGPGNPVLYVGARTGRDGIHGATMASAEFDETTEEKRPTVQVGDPFTEKLLLEACLELMQSDAIVGIQDMGAAGLTSSSVEMAGRGGAGLRLDLDHVPVREDRMTPYEIMLSESQERMLIVAAKGREAEVERIFRKWDLEVALVGEVTSTGKLELFFGGERVGELPIGPLTDGAPLYDRPRHAPSDLAERQRFDPATLPEIPAAEALLALLRRPTIASKEWVYRQYDHEVRLGGVVRPGGDAALVRVEGGKVGLGLSAGCNSRFCELDPREGARHAVAEVCRNLATVGAEPIGLTDCLNFGNPERPEIMWQLEQAVLGLGDACRALEVPIVSGNVSLYNETDGRAILPTPAVAAVGLVSDCATGAHSWFASAGDVVALLGEPWRSPSGPPELGGSERQAMAGPLRGKPPPLDLARERAVQRACVALVRAGLVRSAHDCSEGGLGVALAECCVMGERRIGARVALPVPGRPDLALFSEEPSRIVLSFDPARRGEVARVAADHGAPLLELGEVGGERLEIAGVLAVEISKLDAAWRGGFLDVVARPTAI